MESTETILPDLQSCVLCEDVRCEFNGMNTLVGVINVIAVPALPGNYLRLCIWTRWCGGTGKFRQRSRIIGVDEQTVLAQAEVEFELKEMEGHATNVHYFGGVQFQQFGLHHVEIYLQEELRLRFPLPVVRLQRTEGVGGGQFFGGGGRAAAPPSPRPCGRREGRREEVGGNLGGGRPHRAARARPPPSAGIGNHGGG